VSTLTYTFRKFVSVEVTFRGPGWQKKVTMLAALTMFKQTKVFPASLVNWGYWDLMNINSTSALESLVKFLKGILNFCTPWLFLTTKGIKDVSTRSSYTSFKHLISWLRSLPDTRTSRVWLGAKTTVSLTSKLGNSPFLLALSYFSMALFSYLVVIWLIWIKEARLATFCIGVLTTTTTSKVYAGSILTQILFSSFLL